MPLPGAGMMPMNDAAPGGNTNPQMGMQGQAAQNIDMRPMPEKLPPRRAAGMV